MTINRHEFALYVDITNGNPNGDPDGDNIPRTDQLEHGLITDTCIKRKVRNYIETIGQRIHIRQGSVLNEDHDAAIETAGGRAEDAGEGKSGKKAKAGKDVVAEARTIMCKDYWDVRAFGAVLANKAANDAVKGPVQLGFGRSIEPIAPQLHTITRCAATKEEAGKDNKTMGRKWTVPYGLYRINGYISGALADQTGFAQADLDLLWQALANMWDIDRSAARAEMHPQRLVVIEHGSKLGNAPAHKLLERVSCRRVTDASQPATSIRDYEIAIDRAGLPEGVTIREIF